MTIAEPAADLVDRVRRRFVAEAPGSQLGVSAAVRLAELFTEESPLLPEVERTSLVDSLAVEMVGLGAIQTLLSDATVTDVLVNGPGPIWVERNGHLERTSLVVDEAAIARSIERLVGPLGLRADRANPIVDARLPDGTRATVILQPLAVDGPVLAVRRHRAVAVRLSSFASPAVVELLRSIARGAFNVVVYGATGSGKTTLLNALVAELPSQERIVTIEDVAELRLPGEHIVRLEARPGSAEGVGRADIRQLVRAALRLRPDRIVVGEVRGPEALDMIWAMSTGHKGCLSTCHASGPEDVIRRLETMAISGVDQLPIEAVRAQLHSAVDVLIGVVRDEEGGRRVDAVHRVHDSGLIEQLHAGEPMDPTAAEWPEAC